MTDDITARLRSYGRHGLAWEAADRIDALEAELARFVPTDTWWETFIAGDGQRSMRARTDIYRRQDPT